jgi:peptidoglycan/xylan/chitin deacetylase (PgdA/CDA1 family)
MRQIGLVLLINLFCAGSLLAEVPSGGPAPLGMGTYPQTILVTFKSEQAARKATLRIVPLFHDAKAAFSTRMDDNNIDALKVSEVMSEFGQKGTFFLNDPKGWQGSPDAGISVSGDAGLEVPKRLLAAGNSIGGHTLTHEFLPALSKNAAFKEILSLRIKRETLNNTTLSCFTYPFVSFHCEGMDPHDRDDLEEMLRRSGFYQLAENRYNGGVGRGFYDGYFVTSDGQSWNGSEVEGELTKDRPDDDRPLFLVAMHPWVAAWGGKEFPKLAEVYRKWGGHRDWWYCNQNQYAAYRAQALHSKMETSVQGKTLKVVLTRPLPSDLGDWVPLTLVVTGTKPNQVAGLVCDGVGIKRVETEKSYEFDLDHDKAYGPIDAFGELTQNGNVERIEDVKAGPGGLKAVLNRADTGLSLVLQNGGEGVLRDARVIFRLPLRWKEGVVREGPVSVEKGASVTLDLKLTEREDAVHYMDGSEYLVAQVDYLGDKPSRLYVTQETPAREAASILLQEEVSGSWVPFPATWRVSTLSNFPPDS